MYIRKIEKTNKNTDKQYTYFNIVETKRAGRFVKQNLLLSLGSSFDLPKEKWPMLCNMVKSLLSGEKPLFETSFHKEYNELAKSIADQILEKRQKYNNIKNNVSDNDVSNNDNTLLVIKDKITCKDFRTVGPEHVSLAGAERLGLPEVFKSFGFTNEKANLALASVVARMVHPSNESETFRWLSENSSLPELIDLELESEKSIYNIFNDIYANKEKFDSRLSINIASQLNDQPTIILYDLFNTFLEGNHTIKTTKKSHSKEKSSDYRLITLALVVDSLDFIIRSEFYPGNLSEPGALKNLLEKLKATNKSKVIIDKKIATFENVEWLKSNEYTYLEINREHKMIFDYSKASPIETKNEETVQIYKDISNDRTEAILYCYTENLSFQELLIWENKSRTFERELTEINRWLTLSYNQNDKNLIQQRIDLLFENFKGVSEHYTVNIEDNLQNKGKDQSLLATKITWTINNIPSNLIELTGVYSLRTNDINISETDMWSIRNRLTDIESIFMILNPEFDLLPIYNSDKRIEIQFFISILTYQCIRMILYILKQSNINDNWLDIREHLASHGRLTGLFPCVNGSVESIRKAMIPEKWHNDIYRALSITNSPGNTVTKNYKSNSKIKF